VSVSGSDVFDGTFQNCGISGSSGNPVAVIAEQAAKHSRLVVMIWDEIGNPMPGPAITAIGAANGTKAILLGQHLIELGLINSIAPSAAR
jgi:hypothetical protein